MGWFSDLFGGIGMSGIQPPYTPPTPNGTIYTTSTGINTNSYHNQQGVYQIGVAGGQQGMKGIAPYNGGVSSTSMQAAYVLSALQAYAALIGSEIHHVSLAGDMETNDPKVSVLKLAEVNEVVDGVGVRTSKYDYYVIRKKE